MVVEGGVHVEAVGSVGEAETKVRRLSPLHHFDHKIPGVRSADIALLGNEQTRAKMSKKVKVKIFSTCLNLQQTE